MVNYNNSSIKYREMGMVFVLLCDYKRKFSIVIIVNVILGKKYVVFYVIGFYLFFMFFRVYYICEVMYLVMMFKNMYNSIMFVSSIFCEVGDMNFIVVNRIVIMVIFRIWILFLIIMYSNCGFLGVWNMLFMISFYFDSFLFICICVFLFSFLYFVKFFWIVFRKIMNMILVRNEIIIREFNIEN